MTAGRLFQRLFSALALLAVAVPAGLAQPPSSFNEREVRRQVNVQDKDGVWVLDFRFKDPRLISVDIPGRGRTLVWYLWYQVINNTGQPRTFIPDMELVTLDKPHVYQDLVLPTVQKAIARLEDPTGALDIKNSVTISSEPIPPSKPEAYPRKVTGVATWIGVDPDANRYSIFIAGLSNGWSVDDKGVVRRKTLQLNFRRVGDRYYQDSREIQFVPPDEWLYRASSMSVPGQEKPAEPEKPKEGEAPKAGAAVAPPRKPTIDDLTNPPPLKTATAR